MLKTAIVSTLSSCCDWIGKSTDEEKEQDSFYWQANFRDTDLSRHQSRFSAEEAPKVQLLQGGHLEELQGARTEQQDHCLLFSIGKEEEQEELLQRLAP